MSNTEQLQTLIEIEKIFITGKGAPLTINDPIFVSLRKMISELRNQTQSKRELLIDFANYSESDKTSETTDECVDNYLDSIK